MIYFMGFDMALVTIKAGKKAFRKCWDGSFIWLEKQSGTINMAKPDGHIVKGWQPSQSDMLEEDWEIVETIETIETIEKE